MGGKWLPLVLLLLLPGHAQAHKAPSGWSYPSDCCSGKDCEEISDRDVKPNPDSSYTIVASKETFYMPGTAPMIDVYNNYGVFKQKGPEYRWSPDGAYHRCSSPKVADPKPSYCLFIPRPSI